MGMVLAAQDSVIPSYTPLLAQQRTLSLQADEHFSA